MEIQTTQDFWASTVFTSFVLHYINTMHFVHIISLKSLILIWWRILGVHTVKKTFQCEWKNHFEFTKLFIAWATKKMCSKISINVSRNRKDCPNDSKMIEWPPFKSNLNENMKWMEWTKKNNNWSNDTFLVWGVL